MRKTSHRKPNMIQRLRNLKAVEGAVRLMHGWPLWILFSSLAFLYSLGLYAYLGIFSRYMADDYCFASVVQRVGLWRAQVHLYLTGTNRYSTSFFLSLFDLLGVNFGRFLTVIVVALWVVGTAWLLYRLLRIFRLQASVLVAFLLAEILIFFVILDAPDRYQVFYWRSGMVVYLLSLMLLVFLVALLLNRSMRSDRHRWYAYPLVALAFFISGGFSETTVSLQIGLLVMALAAWMCWTKLLKREGISSGLLFSALIGSLVSFVVILLSPANALRQTHYSASPGLIALVQMSLTNAFAFIHDSLSEHAFRSLLTLILPMCLFYTLAARTASPLKVRPSFLIGSLLIAPIVVYLLLVCVCAPSAYAASSYPENRVLIYNHFLMVALLVFEGVILGTILGQTHHWFKESAPRWLSVVVLITFLLISIYPIYDASKIRAEIPEYLAWAAAWDARDEQIRTARDQGQTDIEVTAHDSIHLLMEMGPDPNDWVNRCAALYYGVESITAHLP